jgi:hypothetical protein
MTPELITECKVIQQNCMYTAEAHHVIARRYRLFALWFQLLPAVTTAVTGIIARSGYQPETFIWLAVLAAAITAVASVLNPQRTHQEHLNAAKGFTVLKNDARALHQTFGPRMADETFDVAVRNLHDRYNDLVRSTAATDDAAFEKARKKIQEGIHEPDRDASGDVL